MTFMCAKEIKLLEKCYIMNDEIHRSEAKTEIKVIVPIQILNFNSIAHGRSMDVISLLP